MIDKDELASLLVIAKTTYRKRDVYALDKEIQNDAVFRLHQYGVLSISALGAIVGVSPYRVEKAIAGTTRPRARGHLNPQHLTMLMYALSNGDVPVRWVEEMTENGTSLSTIADLTGISSRTLQRRKDTND